jgi:hypothetical protein
VYGPSEVPQLGRVLQFILSRQNTNTEGICIYHAVARLTNKPSYGGESSTGVFIMCFRSLEKIGCGVLQMCRGRKYAERPAFNSDTLVRLASAQYYERYRHSDHQGLRRRSVSLQHTETRA